MNDTTNYHAVFANDIPLIDVRAPTEFSRGAMPTAFNIPLLNDNERIVIGTSYKKQGPATALLLGHQLISNNSKLKQHRLDLWQQACLQYPNGYLCCARGGQRSHIVQMWLKEIGINYPLIVGGYQALRQTAILITARQTQKPIILIGGNTGSGKTMLVNSYPNGIDLEKLARHRGSSFGGMFIPQLSQASFENNLAMVLLKKNAARWILEDERRMIGANQLPDHLYQSMNKSPVVVIDELFERRLERIRKEYLDYMWLNYKVLYGEETGWIEYGKYLRHGLYAIRRRLGMHGFIKITSQLEKSLSEQQRTSDTTSHIKWLVPLIKEYYDPMYRYQLDKKVEKIVFRGTYDEVAAWLNNLT